MVRYSVPACVQFVQWKTSSSLGIPLDMPARFTVSTFYPNKVQVEIEYSLYYWGEAPWVRHVRAVLEGSENVTQLTVKGYGFDRHELSKELKSLAVPLWEGYFPEMRGQDEHCVHLWFTVNGSQLSKLSDRFSHP